MPSLIVPIFNFLFGWIKSALPFIAGFFGASVVQLLIGLGWSVTAFTGFNILTDTLLETATASFTGLPQSVTQLLGLMWFDKALNLVLSAGVALMTIKGLKSGTINRGGWNRGA